MRSLHHTFDIDLAAEYGVEEAIIIHHFQFWIFLNKRRKKNFKDGKTWTYQTIQEIADHFPYMDVETVRTIIDRLTLGKNRRSKKDGKNFSPVLVKKNFNKSLFDKTSWYAFVDEDRFLNNSYERANAQIGGGKCPNGDGQMPKPIPDTLTNPLTNVPPPPPPLDDTSELPDLPASPEEEEELLKREKERPSSYGKIKCREKWRRTTLEDIREKESSETSHATKKEEVFRLRKSQASVLDGQTFRGFLVTCHSDRVEFRSRLGINCVGYSCSEKEWHDSMSWVLSDFEEKFNESLE